MAEPGSSQQSAAVGALHDFKIKPVRTGLSPLLYDLGTLACLIAAVVFFFTPGSMDYEDMEDHEKGQVHLLVTQATLLILTGLVCCSLFFESVQHYLEHHIHPVFRGVLNALNTELMGMGFLAIWVYFTLKSEILLDVGEATLCLQDDKFMVHADSLERRLAGGPCASCWGAEGTAGCPHGNYRNNTLPWPAEMTGQVIGTGGKVEPYESAAVILSHDNSAGRRLLGSKVYEYSFEKAVMGYNVHTNIHTGRNLGANAGCPCCRGKPCHDWGGSAKGKCVPETGGHCDELIIHMFEDIHMSLFLVLCMFFARACLLIFQVDLIGDDWVEMEHDISIKGEQKVREEFDQVMTSVTASMRERKEKQETYEFMLFKKRFTEQMNSSGIGVDMEADFSFADYLNICASHIAQEVVEIPPPEWCALGIFFVFFWLGLRQESYMRVRFFVVFAIITLVICFQLIGKVEWVLQQSVTPYPKPKKSSWPCFTKYKPGKRGIVHPGEATAKPEPLFFQLLHGPHGGNPHHVQEGLFWRGNEHFTLHVLRFFMLTSMIFMVTLFTIYPFAESLGGLNTALVVIPIPLIAAALTLVPHELLKDFTIATNVEFMKKPKIVEKVSRDIRIKKSLRAIKVLRSLQSRKFQNADTQIDSIDTTNMDQSKVKELMELKRTFSVFDLDNSGSVDLSELGGLMQALGIGLDNEEKANVMKEFDVSGDGNISFEEFFTFMNRRNSKIDADEVIRDVFEMIDQDGSGTVSKLEFQSTLEKLGTGLKAREIEDLLREIDTGGDGHISLDEFSLVLKKYK